MPLERRFPGNSIKGKLHLPSRILIRSIFDGNSSIFVSTTIRHSGHRSSWWLETITCQRHENRYLVFMNTCARWSAEFRNISGLRDKNLPQGIFYRMCAGTAAPWMRCPGGPGKRSTPASRLKFSRPWWLMMMTSVTHSNNSQPRELYLFPAKLSRSHFLLIPLDHLIGFHTTRHCYDSC